MATARAAKRTDRKRKTSRRPAPRKTEPSSHALIKPDIVPREPLAVSVSQAIENTLIIGDLKSLTSEQRVEYAKAFAKSLGINILTRPFDYILFREFDGGPERLELYLNAKGAAQLRKIHRISTVPGTLKQEFLNDHCITRVDVRDGWGGTDTATGSVTLWKVKNGQRVDLVGREWDNAVMKCETKAKRRATLSICGLAMLDESQLETMQIIGGVTPEGRVYHFQEEAAPDRQLDETAAHGHPEGSERAKQAEAALKRVEEEDARLAAEAKKAQASEPQPKKKASQRKPEPPEQPNTEVPKASPVPPMEFKGTIEIDCTVPFPIVRGDLANIVEPLQKAFASFQWGIDSWWHVAPADVAPLTDALAANGYKVDCKWPPKSSAGNKAPAMTPTPPAEGRSVAGDAAPQTISGTIERVAPDVKFAVITLATKDGKHPTWKCFDKDIWEILLNNKGKLAEVILQSRESKGVTYTNLVGLKRVGSQEYENGKVPIIQNRDREAGGQKTLY